MNNKVRMWERRTNLKSLTAFETRFFLILSLLLVFFVTDVSAETVKFNVTQGADDWDDGSSTGVYITASDIKVFYPYIQRYAWFEIDTSEIPDTAVIDSANLNWYVQSYSASKGLTKSYAIQIWESDFPVVYSGTDYLAGWKSHNLLSTELDDIDVDGVTKFRVSVPEVANLQSRSLSLRAYEYRGDYSAYMNVTYHMPETEYFFTTFYSDTGDLCETGTNGSSFVLTDFPYSNGEYWTNIGLNFSVNLANEYTETYCSVVLDGLDMGNITYHYTAVNCSEQMCSEYCDGFVTSDCAGLGVCTYFMGVPSCITDSFPDDVYGINFNVSGNYTLALFTGSGFHGQMYDYFNETAEHNWTLNCTDVETSTSEVLDQLWYFSVYEPFDEILCNKDFTHFFNWVTALSDYCGYNYPWRK